MKRQNQLNIKRGLLSKLVLLVALFLGSSNAWAQKSVSGDGYSYGFENNNLAAEGWTVAGDNISSNTKIYYKTDYGTVVYSGDYSFQFRGNATPYPPQFLISPQIEHSATGTDITFYYNNNGSADGESFCVGYSTSTNETSSFGNWSDPVIVNKGSGWVKYSATLNSTNINYIAIKYTSQNKNKISIDDITISEAETYKRPKNLSVSSFDSSSATLTWDNGSDETAWEVAYSTKEDFDPKTEGIKIPVTENPYTLTGLIDGVTYYAYVRSNYGGNYSEPSNKISFTPTDNLLLNDDSNTNTNVIIPTNASYEAHSQFIIPLQDLTSMTNGTISSLILYGYGTNTSTLNATWPNTTFDVFVNEINETAFSSSFLEWGTNVCDDATLSINNGEMIINFETPYKYEGGNLLIGIQKGTTGSAVACGWYGKTEDTNKSSAYAKKSWAGGSLTMSAEKFSPKVKIYFSSPTIPVTLGSNGYTTFACPRPLDLTAENLPDGLKAYRAEVSAKEGKVRFKEINKKVVANTGILLAGTANKTYNIPVADSGDPVGDNAFLVNSTGGTFAAEDGYTYFGFKKNSDPITFATFNPSTVAIPTNKAYLKVETSKLPTEAHQLVALFDDGETTSLREIRNEELGIKNAVFFNLNGQRVAQPTKGLYIVNGKKVLVP